MTNILGNDITKKYLKKILEIKKIPHAFIFSGKDGTGKKTIANVFAKTLQCEKGESTPCNTCVSCKTFDNMHNPDVFYIDSGDKKTLGVDIIRDKINNIVNIKPYRNKYKIFIIHNADVMNKESQNALLKTIEEPPNYAVFILITLDYKNFLPTILSRSVILKTTPLDNQTIEDYLQKKENVTKSIAHNISIYSDGSIGKAIKILKSENFMTIKDSIITILADLNNKTINDAYFLAKQIELYKDNIADVLDIFYYWFRDICIYKETKNKDYILDKSNLNLIITNCIVYNLDSLYNIMDNINKVKFDLNFNVNFVLAFEVLFINIINIIRKGD